MGFAEFGSDLCTFTARLRHVLVEMATVRVFAEYGVQPAFGRCEAAMAEHTSGPLPGESALEAEERQTAFISNHSRRVFLLIYRIVGNVADAQDLTQEAFIKALQRREQLKDLDRAAHWLSRIATNTALDFLRRHARVNFCEVDALPEAVSERVLREAAAEAPENAEQSMLRTEQRLHLERGLSVLTERERTALILRDVEGLSADEVASHLKCSKATVRSHIANARVKFRRYLERKPL